MPSLQLALTGALPALGAMLYFDQLDKRRPEPRWALRRVAIAGGVSVIPVIIVELILGAIGYGAGILGKEGVTSYGGAAWNAYLVAGFTEELAKALCVLWFVFRRPEFDERFDGIVYGARAALGFALVENVMYLLGAGTPQGFAVMFVLRALLAVPGHAIWGGMMGYFLARQKFDEKGPGLVGGLAVAVFLHGTYDFVVFAAPVAVAKGVVGQTAAGLGVIAILFAITIFSAIVLRVLASRAIRLDDEASVLHQQLAARQAAASARQGF